MDIEQVGDQVVYYGNGHWFDRRDRRHQRAFIWRGRNTEPERVGPRGFDADVALELTSSGLINGYSENFDGSYRAWVQDLATMELTFFDFDSGPRGADHGYGYLRRINDAGAAAGFVSRSDDGQDGDDAVGFDHPSADMEILPGSAEALVAAAFGVTNAGERAGVMGTETLPEDPEFVIFDAMKWNVNGTRTELVSPHGLDALARNIKDDGSAAGWLMWGEDPGDSSRRGVVLAHPGRQPGPRHRAGRRLLRRLRDGRGRMARRHDGPVGAQEPVRRGRLRGVQLPEDARHRGGQAADPALALRRTPRTRLEEVVGFGRPRRERRAQPGGFGEPLEVRGGRGAACPDRVAQRGPARP